MSKLSDLIFHNVAHKLTSPFGKRAVINTSAGATSSFHNGVDYGTFNRKIPQYAIEDGEVVSVGRDEAYGGALFVWVKYPRLGIKLLHYHLDSYCVKAGQKVTEKTVLGYTGKTGRATGIHLHLGLKLLSGGGYIDPEEWFEENYRPPLKKGKYIVTANELNVRTGPGTQYAKVAYDDFTMSAKKQIKKLRGKDYKKSCFVKGMKISIKKVDGDWGMAPSGWVCLRGPESDYTKKV